MYHWRERRGTISNMKRLLTITDEDALGVSSPAAKDNFHKRQAARAVLLDDNNAVYLLHMTKLSYHKLPGGGVEADESINAALKRELLEELGCEAEVIAEVGEVKEYRSFQKLDHSSFCYLARQVGVKQPSALEEDELADGMQEMKVANIDEAIALLRSDAPKNAAGKFIQRRDVCFLMEAKDILQAVSK